MLHSATTDFAVTFGDEIERRFSASNVVVYSGKKLSVLFLCDGIETVAAKQPVHFSNQENLEDPVIYTLSYFPKAFYKRKGRPIPCAGATSYFRGGNIW
ncbi:hypothetical protein HU200_059723 [Digitaria exilis]|uniref:Uncharacterized protein n=1 Tax=Digitaria exilis TaxID=1010633 RepID=A0A835DY44_9POAL|nr:hypothetical protein HU200_059723 [Digitaria exilis]